METALSTLARLVTGKIIGNPNMRIRGVNTLDEAGEGEMAFITRPAYYKKGLSTKASAILAQRTIPEARKTFLIVENPARAAAQVVRFFHPEQQYAGGIDPRAVLGKGVVFGKGVSIGPYVVMGDHVKIEKNVRLSPGVFIGSDSEIGEGTMLHPNVTIYDHVKIGKRVIIHSGSVIGADGFGFTPDASGPVKMPQVGGVVIEDDVELGAHVTVDRATLGVTRIGRGTKMDDHVHIGHNVKIGPYAMVVAQVGIAGSVEIGSHVTLAGQVGVSDHVRIGDHVVVGARSLVTKDIPDNSKVSGFPPLPHREWLQSQVSMKHLPALREAVATLKQKVAFLEKKLEKAKP